MRSVEIRVPAKVNLWLEVIRKREDGYHDLSSLFLPIGIYDRLVVSLTSSKGMGLECAHPLVPEDSRNLAWRAAELYREASGLDYGLHISLEKEIPVGAGLGGGSADAAGVFIALNRMFPGRVSADRLHALAGRLGADIPFFLYQRPALATGIGDRLQPVDGLPLYPMVLLKPPVVVSTPHVYHSLKLTRGESRIKLPLFLTQPWMLHDVMENDLESVTRAEHPLLLRLKAWLLEHGALGALMSGSGPTVFGVFADRERAREVGALGKEAWKDCWVAVAESLSGPDAGAERELS